MPRIPGLEKALEKSSSTGSKSGEGGSRGAEDAGDAGDAENEKQREEARAKKNVNRSLQRLKEQIKADKLRKRLEVMIIDGMSLTYGGLLHFWYVVPPAK